MDSFARAGLTFPVLDGGPAVGPIVVALHGFPQDAHAFDAVTPALRDAGLRTLVPTLRGYAPTARPKGRAAYRMGELVADVLALIDTADAPQVHLVGHDWGGALAWAVAGAHPERVATLTVLSTPHPAALYRSFVTSDQLLKSWYMGVFQLPVLPEIAAGRTLARTLRSSGLPQADVDRYVAAMAQPGALSGAINWYRGLPLSVSSPTPAISVPTTYVWGRKDFALGGTAARLTARHVTGPYRFVELDAGHWLPEREPERVAQAVLDQVSAA
ncbi:alpha/beta fold hydrolase [Nakamurella flavida]|uniref:Alpha/beta fold hydrolase n=1 Tax=Nakamurella flavida TaxID=363630 RepID=A0A938YRB9_9ACTN|nr:alpha/beta fold hydrolase [Nakamurella flavida]MBM9478024.1 alpha/beta fold hydrolase [Nakamurella flavida]MDP9778259.1 pimeloyl-ACP methyl ester carboxylesterase [Nakamurella flavida]